MSVPDPFDEEEVLDLGKERRGSPNALIGAVVSLAVVVAGGVWLATRGSSPTAVVSSTPTELLTLPSFASPSAPPTPSPTATAGSRESTRCPNSTNCDSVNRIPTHMLAVLQDYIPQARAQSGYTVFDHGSGANGGDRLWYRQLNAHTAKLAILIIVNRRFPPGLHDEPPAVIDNKLDGLGFGFVRLSVHGYSVQVQVDGDRGDRPSLAKLEQLAVDPRLRRLP